MMLDIIKNTIKDRLRPRGRAEDEVTLITTCVDTVGRDLEVNDLQVVLETYPEEVLQMLEQQEEGRLGEDAKDDETEDESIPEEYRLERE